MTRLRVFVALAWAGTVAGAWFLGGSASAARTGSSADAATQVARLEEEVATWRRRAEEASPRLAARAPAPTEASNAAAPSASGERAAVARARPAGGPGLPAVSGPPPDAFLLADHTEPAEATAAFLHFAQGRFAKGAEGDLDVLRTLDAQVVRNDLAKKMFRDATAVRIAYPLLRFAVEHEGDVVGLLDTSFRTMAESPSTFAEFDDDTLEFVQGLAMALPGVVSEEALDVFRGYVRKILETPAGTLPPAIEKNRRRMTRLLEAWTPPLTSEQAIARLASDDVSPAEAMALLSRLSPEDVAKVDAVRWISQALVPGDYAVVRTLASVRLDATQVAALDTRVLSFADGLQSWWLREYLNATGRKTWSAAQPFFDRGFATLREGADALADALLQGVGSPPADYLRSVADRVALSEPRRQQLRAAADARANSPQR